MEGQTPAIGFHQGGHIHYFRLEWVEAIQTDSDQIVKQLIHIPARVDKNILAGGMHDRIHALEHRVNELPPEFGSHLQSALLAPIIPEINGIDIVLERLLDLSNIIIRDRI